MIQSQLAFSTPTCFSLQHFLSSFLKLTTLPLTMWNYVILILTNLKYAFYILLYNDYFSSLPPFYDTPMTTGSEELLRVTRYEHNNEGGHIAENCAVCLGEVEDGAEIGELRCSHVFHKLCLERWVSLKRMTCPLCRGSLAPPPRSISTTTTTTTSEEADFREQLVLFFKFCSFNSEDDDDRHSWWLR